MIARVKLWLALAGAALAAILAFVFGERRKVGRARKQRDAATDDALAARGEAIAERLRREQVEHAAQRERERAAIQEDLEDGLDKVDADLPGAVADALRDARGGAGAGASGHDPGS